MDKTDYLNNRIKTNNLCAYGGPNVLYKYRPFDEYSFDMLEKGYLYLCPAERLDDPTECMTTVDLWQLYDVQANGLRRECADQILQMFVRPYTTSETYEEAENILYRIMSSNGTLRSNRIVDIYPELQALALGVDLVPLVNALRNIPEMFDRPEVKGNIEPLINIAYYARKEMGICSLSQKNDIDYMWKNYAADSSGYCIEYDIENYISNRDIFPVIYQDERETNIVIQLVGSFLGQMITQMTDEKIVADASAYLRLFLTKNRQWEYQEEWRLIGRAGDKVEAPAIKRIIIGRNASEGNKARLASYAASHQIELCMQSDLH